MSNTTTAPKSAAHTCTAECWDYMLRVSQPAECDPFAAREAAEAEAYAEGAFAFPHERTDW